MHFVGQIDFSCFAYFNIRFPLDFCDFVCNYLELRIALFKFYGINQLGIGNKSHFVVSASIMSVNIF